MMSKKRSRVTKVLADQSVPGPQSDYIDLLLFAGEARLFTN